MKIDTNYDFRKDLKFWQNDVDRHSLTLKGYHKYLWQKNLPSGNHFNLSDDIAGDYLTFKTNLDVIRLSSDWIINTYLHWSTLKGLKSQVDKKDYDDFNNIAHTIGSYIIFPLNPLGTPRSIETINTGRCKSPNCMIKDRFDITLECIRRYYLSIESPLTETIKRYDYYFKLFINFRGFCDFFLLQDLTRNNYSEINFFLPFSEFVLNPHPKTINEYNEYRKKAIEFVKCRNKRILEYNPNPV